MRSRKVKMERQDGNRGYTDEQGFTVGCRPSGDPWEGA